MLVVVYTIEIVNKLTEVNCTCMTAFTSVGSSTHQTTIRTNDSMSESAVFQNVLQSIASILFNVSYLKISQKITREMNDCKES